MPLVPRRGPAWLEMCADMLAGHKKIYSLADSANHVIPGHDPQVRAFYPAVSSEAEGIAVRLDVDPAL